MDAHDLIHLAWIIPALPAAGAVILLLFGKRIGEPAAGWFATILMFLAFVGSVVVILALHSLPTEQREDFVNNVSQGFTWIHVGGFVVDFRMLVDPLSTTMITFVTGVGSLIFLYSIGYMKGDPRFSRYFAYLSLFAASMLVLVLASNFLLTFLGWEGVGLCSYLLISFWFERNSAAVAGKKAFVTNRVGDFGYMLAMFMIFLYLGSLNYGVMKHNAGNLSNVTATAIALLLFLGATGKSAQFPLHIWLPDAMEGPTPVSALIHAATMVTAGVFIMVRAHPFLEASDHAGAVVAGFGAFTALFAASIALFQKDIKRVLAWSTISQLGYMFLAVGIGAYTAAIFLMVAHAFFKALLFLGSGSVIHGLHDEQDMRYMGRLQKWLPITAGTFIVGWLAIAGMPPFAGFWAKDEILAQAWYRSDYVLWAVGAVAAVLTAFYMTRQVWLVFYGNERWRAAQEAQGHEVREPHESPLIMLIPLLVLAAASLLGGVLDLPFLNANLDFLDNWLDPVIEGVQHVSASSFGLGFFLSTIAITAGLIGIAAGVAFYRRGLPDDLQDPVEARLGVFGRILERGYYFDDAVSWFVSKPGTWFAKFLSNDIDAKGIDGAVNGIGKITREGGGGLRRIQTGLVRNYALGVVLGVVLLLVYMTTRVSF
jgi:NADH-quinone oxidoreductase subunit L